MQELYNQNPYARAYKENKESNFQEVDFSQPLLNTDEATEPLATVSKGATRLVTLQAEPQTLASCAKVLIHSLESNAMILIDTSKLRDKTLEHNFRYYCFGAVDAFHAQRLEFPYSKHILIMPSCVSLEAIDLYQEAHPDQDETFASFAEEQN